MERRCSRVVVLCVGDHSNASTGIVDTFVIKSTLSKAEIQSAYAQSCVLSGVDFIKDCFVDQPTMPRDTFDKLVSAGLEFDVEYEGLAHRYYGKPMAYLFLYLQFVQLSVPAFRYQLVLGAALNIGGLGLPNLFS